MIAYFVRRFPHQSQTFVATEVYGLEQFGLKLRIFSYERPHGVIGHEIVQRIRSPVTYLPDPLHRQPLRLLRAHFTLFRCAPKRYRTTLLQVRDEAASDSKKKSKLRRWREFVQAGYLAVLIKEMGVTHIHAQMAHTATQVAMLVGMLTGIPFSFTGHAQDILKAKQKDLQKRIAAANFVVTVTKFNQDYLIGLVGPAQGRKIHVRYLGVDLEKFRALPSHSDTKPPLILSVGRLVDKKGFPDLLGACAVLKDKGYAFRTVIIGEGRDRKALQELAERLDVCDVVEFPGGLSQEELIGLYHQTTIFALPCRVLEDGNRDGLPVVLMEAMAVGLPVVSCTVSGIPELIEDGESGLLVPERDVEELAAAMVRLIEDPDLRARLGRNARAIISERFDTRANVRALANLFTCTVDAAAERIEYGDVSPTSMVAS